MLMPVDEIRQLTGMGRKRLDLADDLRLNLGRGLPIKPLLQQRLRRGQRAARCQTWHRAQRFAGREVEVEP